jgi:hypothetical protein
LYFRRLARDSPRLLRICEASLSSASRTSFLLFACILAPASRSPLPSTNFELELCLLGRRSRRLLRDFKQLREWARRLWVVGTGRDFRKLRMDRDWPHQACTSVFLPNLYYYGNTVTVIYKGVKPKPTKMPGRYLNGDVPAMTNDAGTLFSSLPIGIGDQIRVYQKGGNPPPSIYDWNNTDTRDRGPGGDPTTPCQGQPLN